MRTISLLALFTAATVFPISPALAGGDPEQAKHDVASLLGAIDLGPITVTDKKTEQVQYLDAGHCGPRPCASNGSDRWTIMPQGLIYGAYLAGVKESRMRAVWNDENNDGHLWDISLGGRGGILRYGHVENGRPVGWQLDIEGAGQVRLDLDEQNDVTATDYRFGVPLSYGTQTYQVKFAYYHLSSHLGDEFLLDNPGFPRLNYVRDVLVTGLSWTPDSYWRYYAEAGYGVHVDVADPWEFQFGIDYSPPGNTSCKGAPFFAVNGYLREEVDFGGNFVAQAGWAWRRSPTSGMFRAGVEYYNGKDDQFSFFNDSVQKVGFGLWYDY